MKSARLSVSHAAPPYTPAKPLDKDLRGYLKSNSDVVTRVTKPVSLEYIPALSAQSEQPILFENIVEKPGFRLCDILVKHRELQARALGVTREDYLRTLAYRLRRPPRGFVDVAEVAVIGAPDDRLGTRVVAVVVPGSDVSADQLDAFCLASETLARFKRPREYRFVEALPKNNYGKVLKTELRKLLAPLTP